MKEMAGIRPWYRCIAADTLKVVVGFAAATAAACVLLPMTAWAGTYSPGVYITATSEGTKVSRSSSDEGTIDTGEIIISGTSTSGAPRVTITAEANCTAKVTFKNLKIETGKYNDESPVVIKGEGDVIIELDGTNTLTGYYQGAGLEKSDDESTGTLTICDDNGTPGTLNATGGTYGAGIGGVGYWSDEGDSGNIIITGGTINATGGSEYSGAGIGGGQYGDGHDITITGGTVTATGGYRKYSSGSGGYNGGAGIGGGSNGGSGYNINISGGTVKAYAGYDGAGIGGGESLGSRSGGDGHDITISGGDVTAWGTTTNTGHGAGIGGGEQGDGYNINISGGTVDAHGSYYGGAGIGSGEYGWAGDIYISDGTVIARGGRSGSVAIGSHNDSNTGLTKKPGWGKIVISGGNVTALDADSDNYAIVGGNSYYTYAVISDYVEIKDDAKVTIGYGYSGSEPEKTFTYITTCELNENGKLEWQDRNGNVYKTINGVAGSEHAWGEKEEEKYVPSYAVCGQPAIYYKSCTKCGMKSSTLETFTSKNNLEHLYKSLIESNMKWKYDSEEHYHECIREKCPHGEGYHSDIAKHIIEEYDAGYGGDYYYANCTVCYYGPGDSYGFHAHTIDTMEKATAVNATCTTDGNIEYYKCPVTKKPYKYQPATGSDAASFIALSNEEVIIKATGQHTLGTDDSYRHDSESHWHICSKCGQRMDEDVHSPSNCTPKDEKTHTGTCKVCEYKLEEAHDFSVHKSDPTYHWNVCGKCGYEDEQSKKKHEFKDGKCTDENCNYDLKTGHDLKEEGKKAPTCLEDGYEAYWKCNRVGHDSEIFIEDSMGLLVFADEKVAINKLEHEPGSKYVIDEKQHTPICKNGCNAPIEKLAKEHSFSNDICTVCGYKKSSGQTSSSSSSSNINTGWIKDTKGWKYRNSDGILARGSSITDSDGGSAEKILWQMVGGNYFAFGSNEYMLTGWIYDSQNGSWYYCDENTGMVRGWFYDSKDGHWYYLDPSTGAMRTGWQSINGKYYYLAGVPAAPTYSFDSAAKKWIYNNQLGYYPFGAMYASTVTPDNYAVDASGAWVH